MPPSAEPFLNDDASDRLVSRTPERVAGRLLVDWLAERFRYHDAAGWREQLVAGRIRCNASSATIATVLAGGDRIEFTVARTDEIAVAIVHEDEDLLVVDKPSNCIVQRTGAFGRTFLRTLEARSGSSLEPVHRLDRETSGLLVLARSKAAFTALQAQWHGRTVAKEYLALVHGKVQDDAVTVDAAIGPRACSKVPARRGVVAGNAPHAQPAISHFAVVERFAAHTLLRAVPETGRTHQIRVHLEHLGHPLVGDKLYGRSDDEYLAYVQHLKAGGDRTDGSAGPPERQMLHAAALAFAQPRTGRRVALTAPRPDDLCRVLAALATASASGSDACS